MSRKILALRHIPFEDLGLIADSLTARDIEYEYADLYAGDEPDIHSADGLVLMGGPMSANDNLPYLRREMELIGEAASAGLPILGVCLGSQLIAKALGARVYKNPVKEIGWYKVHWTEAAARDPLHQGLSSSETVFQWHGETFDLPPGAELLATSRACRHQAYRVGSNIYGLQYHLEVTPHIVADWLRQDANCGDLREIRTPVDPHAHAPRLKELAAQVFGRWCSLARDRQPC